MGEDADVTGDRSFWHVKIFIVLLSNDVYSSIHFNQVQLGSLNIFLIL